MARRRVKRTVKEAAASPGPSANDANQPQIGETEKQLPLIDQEVERQKAAIRGIRDVEIEHSLTGLRLLRSYFNDEQLQTPALQFFKENLPNLSIMRNGDNGQFEVQWNNKDDNLSMSQAPDGRDFHASLLHRLSIAYPLGGFELSSDASNVRTSLLGVDSLQIKDFVLEGPSDSQMLADGLRTPGASSQRLSIGMTPKTLRLPKPGEMLLSVRGSPLGVYKEDNMEAINESEEG